ncbi:hypothetical protein PFMC_03884 [Plasmodium falciparum CAMP/Malaysia]|uniref:SPX domain-containing protein n=1 Tax=Plasmodium falciparum (isolate Camp / Malaysia) TaxID=5835 RepID=A0A024X6D7_PLAFC|nr:hypothetical protein PFMC_03884 [Plasmodium falciparum CAMP/Malaysia]
MKFSKKLNERAHPKYREHYIAYKDLKKFIKLITGKDTSTFTIKEVTSNFGNIRALSCTEYKTPESRFEDILNIELEKINNFTLHIIKEWYEDIQYYYHKLKDRLIDDIRDVESKLHALGNILIFLEDYKHINFIGFRKITKKFDKHNDNVLNSSFYISVVIKSFFMNFDINVLIYILSVCYKYCRIIKGGISSGADEQYGNKRERRDQINNDRGIENYDDNKWKENNWTYQYKHMKDDDISYKINENVCHEKKNDIGIKHVKYIVKAQNLILIKVEIAKRFIFKYYNIEEHECIGDIKRFLDIISKNKIHNYLITIYFDDNHFSTYHKNVNTNLSNINNEYIRIRSYNYISDNQIHHEHTSLQYFNLYEPSHHHKETYLLFKDIPSSNFINIQKVNDLEVLLKEEAYNHMYNSKDDLHKTYETETIRPTHTFQNNKKDVNKNYFLNNTQFFLNFMQHMKNKKLTSCMRSKVNRIYFSNDKACGYIDENISYWAHNDNKNVYAFNEENEENEESEEGEENYYEQYYNHLNDKSISKNPRFKKILNKPKDFKLFKKGTNKKYAYFNYAVMDISIKEEQKNNDFLTKLNNLGLLKEIWGYSSFLQGISLLYSNRLSTYPHWRIYTCTDLMQLSNSTENFEKGKKKKETKNKSYNKNINDNVIYNFFNEFNHDQSNSDVLITSPFISNQSNKKKKIKKNKNNNNNNNNTKDDFKKSITYTGASARIAHENISIKNTSLIYDNNLYEPLLHQTNNTYQNTSQSLIRTIISSIKKVLLSTNNTQHNPKPKNAVVRVEPKTFFANERTLLQWLNTSVLLSTISITLLNFSNSYGFFSGVIMAPVSIFFILYSFYIYLKRSDALVNKEPINYTDKLGPLILVLTLTFSLSTVVILNIYSRWKTEILS